MRTSALANSPLLLPQSIPTGWWPWARWGILAMAVIFLGLRFFLLTADFPGGISSSGFRYTDEGWYTRGILSWFKGNDWYMYGDFNAAITLPIGQMLHFPSFYLFGPEAFSARLTSAVSTVLAIVLCSFFVYRHFKNSDLACLVFAFLSCNYILFCYSRVAILEPVLVLFAIIIFFMAHFNPGRLEKPLLAKFFIFTLLTNLLFFAALLIKTNIVMILPAILFFFFIRQSSNLHVLLRCGISIILISPALLALITYNYFTHQYFLEDYLHFKSINVDARVSLYPLDLIKNSIDAFLETREIGPLLFISLLFFLLFKFKSNFPLLKDPVIMGCILWLVGAMGILSTTGYHPVRYFIPLIPPITILVVALSYHWIQNSNLDSRKTVLRASLLYAAILISNSAQIVYAMVNTDVSFQRMSTEVAKIVQQEEKPMLLGHMANSIELFAPVPTVNSVLGPKPLSWRLDNFHPTHYVCLGEENETIDELKQRFTLVEENSWDVYENFKKGKKVHLYKLMPLEQN